MKTLLFSYKFLFMTLMSLPLALCSSDDTNEDDSIEEEIIEETCTGEMVSHPTNTGYNRNHKLFDADWLGSYLFEEGNGNDFAQKFIHNNGVFVCTGTFDETGFSEDGNLALYALNQNFESLWTFPKQPGKFYDVIHASDNNYVAVGRIGNGDVSKIHAVKVNLSGELIWEYTVDTTDEMNLGAYATTIVESSSGGYIVVGDAPYNSNLFGFGDKSFILSLSDTGEQQWAKPLSNAHEPLDMIMGNNGNFIVAFNSHDFTINEVGTDGEVLKEVSFGSSEWDRPNHILQLSDGNYIITGATKGSDGDVSENKNYGLAQIWAVKIDASLNLINEQPIGFFGSQIGINMAEMNDGNLLLSAHSTIQYAQGEKTPIFIRLTKDLCIIDWDDSLGQDEYLLTDVIWLEDSKEAVTFSHANDRGNIHDTTDDFYHHLISFKLENN
ncbi:hypothetical protein Q4Q34_08570 [Flavivirga abyssicola]|uniref:hypothetical protein n=1 Tax=Flavivirga abyssicola TaxID=3063533 RepID=UPI0026E01A40|nr:hypothetical protein [Flavivirga sp. MEBiC07777]WVK15080.1 hypothetical protein Q4Q34_08570 [Flavivirga sp. MEBiC07777]